MVTVPRIIVAAPASGHGKTTVATGLMAALRRRGHVVSGHKVGPDYIDPGYHALATGRPGRNLDPHLVGEHRIGPLLAHGAQGADLAVIEGVMGLFDGQIGGEGFASTAHIATLTRTPVVLVVDISHASRSIAALVQGMRTFDPTVEVAGVVLNKAGSVRHSDEVVRSLGPLGVPVLGVLQRDDGIVAPSRHLGLIPAAERADAAQALDRLAGQIAERIDLERIVAIARNAPSLAADPWDPAEALTPLSPGGNEKHVFSRESRAFRYPQRRGDVGPVVAVAGGRAFTFQYAETAELLEAAGCRTVPFDPLIDERLPEGTSGLYLGGGFPEVHALALGANAALLEHLRGAIGAGLPTVAECAGLLYLCRSVDDVPMVGALDAEARMTGRLTLAYRTAEAAADTLLGPAGTTVTGHEFHRTTVTPGHGVHPAWRVADELVGFGGPTLHASYLHTHWAGHPALAARFTEAVHRFADADRSRDTPHPPLTPATPLGGGSSTSTAPFEVDDPPASGSEVHQSPANGVRDPLRHHGDAETGPSLVDFAVNVYDGPRPDWLDAALAHSLTEAHHYPDPTAATHAIARHHGREPDDALVTAGAAEAFGLIARLRPWSRPVVVHPQFTEPDVALAVAGHRPEHVLLDPSSDFALDPALIPADADLVIVGNPTNPTSVLHSAGSLRLLLRPGRLVVVDEAFMDSVPTERATLSGLRHPGLLVTRSLTKLWSVPGLRAGYVLGHPDVIAELREGQTPWSASTPALATVRACASDVARAEAARRAWVITRNRAVLTDGLTELGIPFVPEPAGPFVLARPGRGLHAALRAAGYAVRRADTFPGLDDSWIRIAVRSPEPTRKLLAQLRIEQA